MTQWEKDLGALGSNERARESDTPPKFNIAPEKWWLEDDPFLLGFGNFSGANSLLNFGRVIQCNVGQIFLGQALQFGQTEMRCSKQSTQVHGLLKRVPIDLSFPISHICLVAMSSS